MNVAIAAESPRAGISMQALGQRFAYMLMDARAAYAMRMLVAGATFWETNRGMTVAMSGSLVELSRREAGQITALTRMRATSDPQRLAETVLSPALRNRLLHERNLDFPEPTSRSTPMRHQEIL